MIYPSDEGLSPGTPVALGWYCAPFALGLVLRANLVPHL